MKAETNGYTQTCDKCHRLVSGEAIQYVAARDYSPFLSGMTFSYRTKDGLWMNVICNPCHLALRLEGQL